MDVKEFYLGLCRNMDEIIKDDNPCDFVDGKCIVARTVPEFEFSCCCRKCKNLSPEGCTIKSLGCKLYFCLKAESRMSPVSLRTMQIVKNMAKDVGIIALHCQEY